MQDPFLNTMIFGGGALLAIAGLLTMIFAGTPSGHIIGAILLGSGSVTFAISVAVIRLIEIYFALAASKERSSPPH